MQKYIKALGMLQRLEISETELEDLQSDLLKTNYDFMKSCVVYLVDLLMTLPAHKKGYSQDHFGTPGKS